ncbi:MAG: hypothetical protein ACXVCV_02330, partial [Polyangia bacterium]
MELPARAGRVTRAAAAAATLAVAVALGAGCARHGHGRLDAAHALAEAAQKRLAPLDADGRRRALASARIFEPVDVAARDLYAGPHDPYAARFGETVSCAFIEPRADRVPLGGTTPKFFCELRHVRSHVDVKIKYGRSNREIYGELLGSRLFWALGVAVDRDYPVRVRCHGCPPEPWRAYRDFPARDPSPRQTRLVDDAVLQRLYPAAVLETHADEGWTFAELDTVDAAAGGAPRVEVDALRLLAAFVAHGDDKPENQRLVCPFDAIDAAGRCTRPRLLVADLGSTFGRGASPMLRLIDKDSRPSFAAWSSLPLWEDRRACRAHLETRTAPPHPIVSEAGRRFLAER